MDIENAQNIYSLIKNGELSHVEPLSAGGSARRYFRLTGSKGSVIMTEGDDVDENRSFIYLSNHFSDKSLAVPSVLWCSEDCKSYVQTDLGDASLYSLIAKNDNQLPMLLKKSMKLLAEVHIYGGVGLDYNKCYPVPSMNRQAVMWDLNYFKYCFLKNVVEQFSEVKLEADFQALASMLTENLDEQGVFMIRDFQSRNVMIHNNEPYLIDFQGGRKGLPHYDVASFLWQARAGFSQSQREELIDCYLNNTGYEPTAFRNKLKLFVLFRLLQVLGAYGFRGNCQHKSEFILPTRQAVASLGEILDDIPGELTYLHDLLKEVSSHHKFEAVEETNTLTVEVNSFSFKKGVPTDMSGNGGGFVFDCRAIHNPGRYAEYKRLTGRDESVKRFLEDDGEILTFLENVYGLVDASVDRYVSRGFKNLQINFGCTGGQHRSVYCAEAVAAHIARRGDVRVLLNHVEQGLKFKF